MSREIRRYPPVEFPHEHRVTPERIEHRDRVQSLSIDAARLAEELRGSIRGEVRFDDGARALYSTDASNYRQVPIGVVVPRDADDVIAAVALARKHGAPILGRGAGTSLAGQCCNVAVVVDMSKYMHGIAEMNPAQKFARVQPGIVLDDLRRAAELHTLTFGPDPATHAQCTLGGMIGNNSCGVHSIMSGKTVDNIEELDVLTYDGLRMRVGATSDAELESIIREGGRRGEIYAGLKSIRDRYGDLVRAKFPRIPRRVSGYNLDELLPENGFHVARALVGSESTCVLVLEAKTKLVYSPPARALLVAGYPSVYEAADDVPRVLGFGPIGLEGFDDLLVRDQQFKKMNPHGIALLPPGGGWLLVEFGGDTLDEAMEKARRLASTLDAAHTRVFDNASKEARFVWAVRESGLGATGHVPGKPLMWEGWEDAAVAPEKLGRYLRELRALLERYEYGGDLYGHFGDGCVHTRTNFDLTTTPGIAKFRAFLEDAADLVASHGGSFSGEHGDGQARAALLEKMFGPELMNAFREFKALWDPQWKMNPGKLVLPYQPDENLRLGADYAPWNPETHFTFAEDHGRMNHAVLRCVGVGRCRRLDGGTMCPSYQVTREEEHSTRGRARLLFEMFQGQTVPNSWRNEAVKESLDLCLACKGCKGDCPTQVDMATYKAEFMSHYYAGRLRPMPAYTMGLIYWWAGMASLAPMLANAMTRLPFMKTLAGVAKERQMPRFARKTFRQLLARKEKVAAGASRSARSTRRVVLWADTFNNHFLPETAMAAVEVLERAGFEVTIPRKRLCCGRPLYDWGFLGGAKRLLRETLDALEPDLDAGIPIVGLEPSCVSVFRDELTALFPNDSRAARLAQSTFTLSEFLLREDVALPTLQRKALVQAHCHHKSVIRFDAEEAVLRGIGLDLAHPDSGCCGMAGAFGFEKKHYDLSMKVGERVLLPMVREAEADTLIIADGFSCREQIEQTTGRTTLHFAEVLKLAYDAAPASPKAQ
ncbi:MAG TPA: FAD-linked oxidase C-terminal domain-containing protein [Thermoanaerobaculia bacterium]|nr:FAD-linked oxidase C-terminal domain-containing protein [Thermoanaerobaculia bacterium]